MSCKQECCSEHCCTMHSKVVRGIHPKVLTTGRKLFPFLLYLLVMAILCEQEKMEVS